VRRSFTRRRALGAAAAVAGSGAAARLSQFSPPAEAATPPHQHHPLVPGSAHSGFADGSTTVDPLVNGFDPSAIMRDFDWGKTRPLAGGRMLREWELIAYDKQIEIVPGVKFSAWTYNGRVPGAHATPPARATCCGSTSSTRARILTRFTSTAFTRP